MLKGLSVHTLQTVMDAAHSAVLGLFLGFVRYKVFLNIKDSGYALWIQAQDFSFFFWQIKTISGEQCHWLMMIKVVIFFSNLHKCSRYTFFNIFLSQWPTFPSPSLKSHLVLCLLIFSGDKIIFSVSIKVNTCAAEHLCLSVQWEEQRRFSTCSQRFVWQRCWFSPARTFLQTEVLKMKAIYSWPRQHMHVPLSWKKSLFRCLSFFYLTKTGCTDTGFEWTGTRCTC